MGRGGGTGNEKNQSGPWGWIARALVPEPGWGEKTGSVPADRPQPTAIASREKNQLPGQGKTLVARIPGGDQARGHLPFKIFKGGGLGKKNGARPRSVHQSWGPVAGDKWGINIFRDSLVRLGGELWANDFLLMGKKFGRGGMGGGVRLKGWQWPMGTLGPCLLAAVDLGGQNWG